jgi:hypothetical protein
MSTYQSKDLVSLIQSVFFIFVMGIFFNEIFHFTKTTGFSLKGGWGTFITSFTEPWPPRGFISIFLTFASHHDVNITVSQQLERF